MKITFKQNCLVCKQDSDQAICQFCQQDLSLFELDRHQYNLMLIPKIHQGLVKVDFTHVLALADYQWPLSKLLTGLKFAAHIPNAQALATLFVKHCLTPSCPLPQLIIPIPLYKNRYLLRKFNQSIELAKQISFLANLKMDTSIISRDKSTQAQTDLTAAQRRRNLRSAFNISEEAACKLKEYDHVALFDDVITTGTTMNCAYQTLRKHNPKLQIDVWSICLTLAR